MDYETSTLSTIFRLRNVKEKGYSYLIKLVIYQDGKQLINKIHHNHMYVKDIYLILYYLVEENLI